MTRTFLLYTFLFLAMPHLATAHGKGLSDSLGTGIKTRLGFGLGWEHPYSAGMELSFSFNEAVDINTGFGFGFSGAKFGVGCRLYPFKNNKISPVIGGFLFHATGIGDIKVNTNEEEAFYRITPDNAFLINGGIRLRSKSGDYFLATLGHSFAFEDKKAVYKSGSTDPFLNDFADAFATGGFSICLGYLMQLGK